MYKTLFIISVIAAIIANTLKFNLLFMLYCIISTYVILYIINKREVIAKFL